MAINNLAPGVYSTITDLSTFVDTQPSTTGFIAIISESGPDNELIRVTPSSFNRLFGNPNINYTNNREFGLGPYVANNFLTESNNLYVVRCLPQTATYSNIFITTDDFLEVADATTGAILDQTVGTDTTSIAFLNTQNDFTGMISSSLTDDEHNDTGYNLLAFRGLGRGEFYNNILIDINQHPSTNDPFLSGFRQDLYIMDIYQLQKFSNRVVASDSTGADALYADYNLVESFEISFDPEAKDDTTDSIFVEDIINNYSNLIRVNANRTILKEIHRRTKLAENEGKLTINFAEGFVQSHTNYNDNFLISYGNAMAEGYSGGMFTQHALNIDSGDTTAYPGFILAQAYAGILPSSVDGTGNLVSSVIDTENYLFDILLDAGYPEDVKTTIITLAETRRDCLAIIDNGDHFTATSAVTDRTSNGGPTSAYNTPYASLYEPYSKIYDIYTGTDIFVPPSFHVAKIVGFNDKTTEIWYPLAGFNRAVVNNIKELRYNPALGDRESFIKYQINPIVRFGNGYALFSQRTTLRRASAMQEIHIIRLQMFIDRALKEFCRNFIFELNDEETRSQIRKEINVLLSEIKSRRGLQSYTVNTPNSEYDIKRRRITVNITLKPTRSVEQIFLNYFLT